MPKAQIYALTVQLVHTLYYLGNGGVNHAVE